MIYLNAEIVSWLWEDTFWTWFKREFPSSSFDIPKKLNDDDILLRYSTLWFLPITGKQLAICWELYPNMKDVFGSDQWDEKIKKVEETAKYATFRTVPTDFSVQYYKKFGSIEIIPIGVDTELFKPLNAKTSLREKYELPLNRRIWVWTGTTHPMKWYGELVLYAKNNPDIYWIIISKDMSPSNYLMGAKHFTHISQSQMAELMWCADFFLSTSKLSPFYMAEWEAMACDIPFVITGNDDREFIPSEHPRSDVFKYWWDRISAKKKWEAFFKEKWITW